MYPRAVLSPVWKVKVKNLPRTALEELLIVSAQGTFSLQLKVILMEDYK